MEKHVAFCKEEDILIVRQDADAYVMVDVACVDEGNYGLGSPPAQASVA